MTAFIGPSGCGKNADPFFDRMNDLVPGAGSTARSSTTARISTRATSTRSKCAAVGMVFQKPNPFPKSIYDNLAFGPRLIGIKSASTRSSSTRCTQAAFWDEVKDRLK